jgi:hypothetical protein
MLMAIAERYGPMTAPPPSNRQLAHHARNFA